VIQIVGIVITTTTTTATALLFHFMKLLTNSMAPEPEGSSPHSQQPASDPYPEPAESTPHPPPPNLPKVHFDPILPSAPWSFKWSFSTGLAPKTLYTFFPSPLRATCLTHLILLDLISLMIPGDEYKL
jgi:hypothetical protein